MENENKTLYIPINIKTRIEFFDGFGVPELFITLAVTGITTAAAIVVNAFCDFTVTALAFFVLVSMAATVMLIVKDSSNISVIDQIRFIISFSKAQKKYPYRHKGDWLP